MSALLFPIFNYIYNNRWTQIVITIGGILVFWKINNAHQRRAGARELQHKVNQAQAEANASAREHVRAIRDKADERIERAETVRDSVADGVTAGELPDASYRRLFGKRKAD